MKLQHRHIIGLCLLCVFLLGFASCINESFDLPHDEEEENSIYLTFHTAVAGVSTRADEIPDDARINQLLVVIVSENNISEEENIPEGGGASEGETGNAGKRWVVEHSRLVKGVSNIGLPLTDEYTFKVRAGCRKRIYLLANCAGLKDGRGEKLDLGNSSFIPQTSSGASGKETGNAPIDDFVFNLSDAEGGYQYDPVSGIPMTAMYEIEIPDRKDIGKDEFSVPTSLYVVRAATKFSFNFTNRSSRRNITVTGFSLTKAVEDRMYLMPHVNKNKEGRYWVVNSACNSSIPLPETDTPDANHKVTEWDWIHWMVAEAGKTEKGDNIDQYQWLTDYDIPAIDVSRGESGEESSRVKVNFKNSVTVPAKSAGSAGEPVSVPSESAYLPESRTLKTIGTEEGGTVGSGTVAFDLKLQEYELTVYTKETFLDEPEYGTAQQREVEREYSAGLEHLASLFRNTHVKVNVCFKDYTLDWEVDVEPYWEVELDPVFGLDEPEKPVNPAE
jgi:hypothetical protein